ncbi:MAG: DUF2934 domain-containing protein [Candidatus Omnitrophica bacterium]|nr:DUF2934 domain-containing protein [Candidatus Omnitrophota bacterium]
MMANARGWLKQRRRSPAASPAPEQQEIARLAYEFYERRGRVEGYALDDWLKAEAIVKRSARRQGAPA